MTTKKTTKKESAKEIKEKAQKSKKPVFFQGIGRRKEAVAQVRLFVSETNNSTKGVLVNGKALKDYFPITDLSESVLSPLRMAGILSEASISAKISGGGIRGQAEAARLGVSRALIVFNPDLKKVLRDNGFLTRDARKVERKKPGLKKARRAPQWQKR